MKKIKTLLTIFSVFFLTIVKAQKDTTISISMSINQFRALLVTIDQNIDSKRASKELIDFLQSVARIAHPTNDWDKKAKDAAKEIENKPKNK